MKTLNLFFGRRAMTLFLATMTAASALATNFIKDVMVIGGSKNETNNLKSTLRDQGWTVITKDLNAGAGGDYIFLLYKSEDNTDGINHGYITDFYIDNEYKDSITFQRRTYYPVPFDGGADFKRKKGDLNRGAGGDYIYLYYTKDYFTDNRAVTGIIFSDTQSGAVGLRGGGAGYDLNAGAGGDYIYMHLTTTTTRVGGYVTFANDIEDRANWSITPDNPVSYDAIVTLTYSGTKTVQNVTAGIPWDGNLADLNSEVTATDGMTLTGKLGAKVKVSIADGATVVLQDVTIDGINWEICPWAGITCEGDATLVLKGTNYVKGFHMNYPGIFVPEGKTLTIRGNGSLEAHSGNSTDGYGAGIGGGWEISCGNIVIEGGTIVAYGGKGAAGIGGGHYSNCGDITITDDVTKVTAFKRESPPYSIGAGYEGTCGTITIGGEETGPISESPFIYTGNGSTTGETTEEPAGGAIGYIPVKVTYQEADGTWTFSMPTSDVVEVRVEYETIPTGIKSGADEGRTKQESWYTIDGRKLNGKPSQRGVYISNGRKIVYP